MEGPQKIRYRRVGNPNIMKSQLCGGSFWHGLFSELFTLHSDSVFYYIKSCFFSVTLSKKAGRKVWGAISHLHILILPQAKYKLWDAFDKSFNSKVLVKEKNSKPSTVFPSLLDPSRNLWPRPQWQKNNMLGFILVKTFYHLFYGKGRV